MAAHIALPWIHRLFSNLKPWDLGVYHGLRNPTGSPTVRDPRRNLIGEGSAQEHLSSAPPGRNRWFADSPLEGDGFELPVPREKGWSFDGSLSSAPFKSLRVSTKTTRFLHQGPIAAFAAVQNGGAPSVRAAIATSAQPTGHKAANADNPLDAILEQIRQLGENQRESLWDALAGQWREEISRAFACRLLMTDELRREALSACGLSGRFRSAGYEQSAYPSISPRSFAAASAARHIRCFARRDDCGAGRSPRQPRIGEDHGADCLIIPHIASATTDVAVH
jgi:hypothetical protein